MLGSVVEDEGLWGKTRKSKLDRGKSFFSSPKQNVKQVPQNSISFNKLASSHLADQSQKTFLSIDSILFHPFFNHSINWRSQKEVSFLSRFEFHVVYKLRFLVDTSDEQDLVIDALCEVSWLRWHRIVELKVVGNENVSVGNVDGQGKRNEILERITEEIDQNQNN
jgi:hypothetical protein